MDQRPLSEFGLRFDGGAVVDVGLGLLTGGTCIAVLFVVEWRLGWILPTHTFECVVPGESWGLNITWDVLFHLGVAVNEELQLRGWLLHSVAAGECNGRCSGRYVTMYVT